MLNKLADAARTRAAISLVTNCFGICVGFVLYYNYILLEPFFEPLLWAVMLSVPLHLFKTQLMNTINKLPEESGVNSLIWNILMGPYWLLFGPLHKTIHVLISFLSVLLRFSVVPKQDRAQAISKVWVFIGSLKPTTSTNYFELLFWALRMYLCLNILAFLGARLLISVVICLIFLYMFKHFVSIVFATLKKILQVVDSKLGCWPSTMAFKIYHIAAYIPQTISKRMIRYVKQNASSVSSISIIMLFFVVSFIIFCFCLYQVASETSSLVSISMDLVNKALPEHLSTQIEESLKYGVEQGVAYGQITAVYPDANTTYLLSYTQNVLNSVYNRAMGNMTDVDSGLLSQVPETTKVIDLLANSSFLNAGKAAPAAFYELKLVFGNYFDKLSESQEISDTTHIVTEYLSSFGSAAFSSGLIAIGTFSSVIVSVGSSIMAGLETLMQFVLFLTALFELLQCENTVISIFSIFGSEALVTTMGDVMSAVFLSTVKLFTFHALFSWLLFSILGVHLHYILALFSGLFAVLPLSDPLYICILAALQLFFQGRKIASILLVVMHYYFSGAVDGLILEEIPGTHSLLVGMSMLVGFQALGARGVLLGPLIFSMPVIAYTYLQRQTTQSEPLVASPSCVHEKQKGKEAEFLEKEVVADTKKKKART